MPSEPYNYFCVSFCVELTLFSTLEKSAFEKVFSKFHPTHSEKNSGFALARKTDKTFMIHVCVCHPGTLNVQVNVKR